MQKWTKKNEIVNASSCAKMNNIHAVLEQMYLNKKMLKGILLSDQWF